MALPLLATKLYIPPRRPNVVLRSRLSERLNAGLHRKLTLISAPAGFGKTTLVSEWVAVCDRPVAWLSLDEGENDPARFLAYLVSALQTLAPTIGAGILGLLQSPQPPPIETCLPTLLNEIATLPQHALLILDDCHLLDARPVEQALAFLVEHLPPQLHLVIATREDPLLPLARLRARDQISEVRVADLRFTPDEAAMFLNQVMHLDVSAEDVSALETRTEGWIAGLQLAALSLREREDAPAFIRAFAGGNRYIVDYLAEEVLQRQPEHIQRFLLRTSVLDRLCGPLCDAVLDDPTASGQATLDLIERANLFIVPLDNERRWYRYHHLFADLLRQRLHQRSSSSPGDGVGDVAELHARASQWYEDHDLEMEAFHHAAAANDIARAERLIEGAGMPLYFRGARVPVLNWLQSLPATLLDGRPALWVAYVTLLTFAGNQTVERQLQAAEAALAQSAPGVEPSATTRNLFGHIAALRAMLAIPQHQLETIIAQSHRALALLHRDNLPIRTVATWTLGYGYQLQGDRAAASQAFTEAIAISQASGNIYTTILATGSLGQVQEAENQLSLAAHSYQRVLQLVGDPAQTMACEAYLGLARLSYEWNDLHTAGQHAHQCLQLTRHLETVDTFASLGVVLARLQLARGDVAGAVTILDEADAFARHTYVHKLPEIAAARVMVLLRQGNLVAAAHLAQTAELPISQARVHLARGDASAALAVLVPLRQQAEANARQDERLKVMVLQAVALHLHGERDTAVHMLGDALTLAEPGGFIRLFVDEGMPMAQLLAAAAAHGMLPGYIGRLLAAWEAEQAQRPDTAALPPARPGQPLIELLSERELEVLRLIAQGLSNRQICERLFLALDTIKGHNQKIFAKLQVQRRTEAVARARELGLV